MGIFSYIFGKEGEDRAASWLMSRGFTIMQRNFKSRFGEIDIIAKKDDILHFIEVKASTSDYEAEYRVNSQKLRKLFRCIEFYELTHEISCDIQLDLIVVNESSIKIIENITL
ncbi:YraN family protein [Campylobacter sp. 19-13652]|uniref:YraN family protein n=1 Tax=Campylobacter sp. 19-13652 TaxID=2840180 RepID=UPI001C78E766|nr:YraN family protein [Campylobacter sp. 19-13652]BCX80110.1 UPF0102 protein [Campylobacter sp. 19-13652]